MPRVWVLIGDKPGDNAQCLALAQALGMSYAVKRLRYRPLYRLWNLALGASLTSLDRGNSDRLAPPWPDLVIAAGRRSVPVARWIRRQSHGRTRLVQIGRPRAPYRLFDLVVTTPQYGLPVRDNILHLATPLTSPRGIDAAESARRRLQWQSLPRPWIAVLMGGSTPPYDLDSASAGRLGQVASDMAARHGGALLVTTSRRTPPPAVAAMVETLRPPRWIHRFGDPDNPYAAYLALADAFIVTADSASMLADACATGRPVFLFDLPTKPSLQSWLRRAAAALLGPWRERVQELGLLAATRELAKIHSELLAGGRLQYLDATATIKPRPAPPEDALELAATRVRALLAAHEA